ncbi:MAG: small, acid-soluble spore protein, alpha/beta type [Firmicutes bacterium]|nr:small, acid-soluble spore protein, alpha/beta type [Bacillota bacterium]
MDIAKSRKSKMKKTPADMEELKLEIAEELGLLDKVKSVGWAGLSAKETGRMGGLLTKKKRELGLNMKKES